MDQQKKPKKTGSVLYTAAVCLLLAVFAVSAFFVARYVLDSRQQESRYDELAAMVDAAKESAPDPVTPTEAPEGTAPGDTVPAEGSTEETEPTEMPILPEYAPLYELNNDMVGWIVIESTRINYPVMQTPEDPDYYLKRNFDHQNNVRGCIYAEGGCDLFTPSDNVTLYGHNMNDGSMFADLRNYTVPTYWENHRYIQFDTLTEHHTYEIFAVFTTTASRGMGFRYHLFTNAENQEEFDEFISQCLELALYDTDIIPEYGDKILCLSTCEYSQKNGRLVVAAVRID